MLVDPVTNGVVAGDLSYGGMNLDEVEKAIAELRAEWGHADEIRKAAALAAG